MHVLNATKCHRSPIAKELLARIHDDGRGYNFLYSARCGKIAFESLNDSLVCILFDCLNHQGEEIVPLCL
jgi:hypothetical protein